MIYSHKSLFTASLLLAPSFAIAAPWAVDSAQSKLQFSGTQGKDAFTGGFKKFTPVIEFDLAHPEQGKVDVTIDIASAYIDNDKDKQEALPTDAWFAAKQFPDAKFHATAIHADKTEHHYIMSGDLTVRGVTKSVTFPFALEPNGETMKATGEIDLKRNDFGIGQGKEWSTDQWIAYPVKVTFTLLATPAK